jgi:uncharacterized protein
LQYSVSVRFISDGVIKLNGNEISISIKSSPEQGNANRELVKKLAAYSNVNEGRDRIISCLTSRKKLVEVS